MLDDGCLGTDWFFQDDPVPLGMVNGALAVGNYRITPESLVFKIKNGDRDELYLSQYNPAFDGSGKDYTAISNIIACAMTEATDPQIQRQLASAQAMIEARPQEDIRYMVLSYLSCKFRV